MYWLFGNPSPSKRVARGVKFLDETRPGWASRVNLETLNVMSPHDCVLAQVDDCRYYAVSEIRSRSNTAQAVWGSRRGFETSGADDTDAVTREWQRVIRMRRGAEILAA